MVETKLIKAPINAAVDMKQWLDREAVRDAATKAMYKDHTRLRADQLAAKLGARVGCFNIIQNEWNVFDFRLAGSPLVRVTFFMNYQPQTKGMEHMMSVKVRSHSLERITFSDRSESRWFFNAGADNIPDSVIDLIFEEIKELMRAAKNELAKNKV